MASQQGLTRLHLLPNEQILLSYAADDVQDIVTLSETEELVLQLARRVQEQQLEKALLEQEFETLSGDDVEEQLATAEREFLEARASFTVRSKATRTVLMTDPILKAVHSKANIPPERALFRLVNRRDVLALAQENLSGIHDQILRQMDDLKIANLTINRENQELVRELLELTKQDSSWREQLGDPELELELTRFEAEYRRSKAKWDAMKNIASAIVVGSGLDWASDDALRALVLDESDD
ncbi:hypothetical protein N7539_001895 [Penicillium diatomitis]|uniref:Centromere protein H C-terminal domain-containing protein n=1 Tax=Penicillium diatomitis TaxID=2819901 RepID=A0A9X0C0M9_9EURO|nr:uncharacterized protein N7539_001895 [Penicillium diatomitis]KAJ5493149.1 hypothetical protein N7539_001895 [Penicillium diatomitis]